MTSDPEALMAVERIEARVAEREAGARAEAKHRHETIEEALEFATVGGILCADLRALLTRLSAAEERYRVQYKATSDAIDFAEDETMRADAAEAESERRRVALEEIASGDFNCAPGQYSVAMQGRARAALQPSRSTEGETR